MPTKSHLDDVGVDLMAFSMLKRVAGDGGTRFEEEGEGVVVREGCRLDRGMRWQLPQ